MFNRIWLFESLYLLDKLVLSEHQVILGKICLHFASSSIE